jgi:hypothetical protein
MSPTHRSLPYDHLPAAANSTVLNTTPLNPFNSTGRVTHVTRGWIAAACVSRVATAAGGEGGGTGAFRRGPNRAAPNKTIIPFHTCKLAATDERALQMTVELCACACAMYGEQRNVANPKRCRVQYTVSRTRCRDK